MGVKDTDLFNWLKEKVNILQQYTEELSEIDNGVFYNVASWTPLKLIVLGYFTSVYTRIIPKTFKNMVYIDLFANCGINRVNKRDFVVGSPVVAITSSAIPFDKIFLVEKDPKYANTLHNRLKHLSTNNEEFVWVSGTCKILREDCNDAVHTIINEIEMERRTHCLSFIDPYGMEVHWSSLEQLLINSIPSDIIFTFMTQGIQRVWGRAKNSNADRKRLNEFYGGEEWKRARNANDLLLIYENKIQSHEKITRDIEIKGQRFHYHLIFVTRPTRGGNPWLNAVDRVKRSVESATSEWIEMVLDQLSGRQQTLL